jgi:dipeptidyl aminopeptidase/acylaminoacyl peptidase
MNAMFLFALSAATALCAIAPVAAAPAKMFDARLLATLDRIDDPKVSPDGRTVLYSVRSVDYEGNQGVMSLWLVDTKTKAARKLAISQGGASAGRWSPDGKSIYFLSSRNGDTAQIFRTDLDGEKAEAVTALPLDVGAFSIAPDGKTLVLSMAVFPDCPDIACTKARLDAKSKSKVSGQLYDRLFVRHWDAWADGTRNHLFAMKIEGASPVDLMPGFDGDCPNKPFGGNVDFAISPDGKIVLFSAKWAGKDEPWTTNFDIWQVPIDASARPKNLTEANKAWDAAPLFSPDGKTVVYRAMKRPGFESDRFGIMVRDFTTGDSRELLPTWDRSADGAAFSPDGETLYVTAMEEGQAKLFAVEMARGTVAALTDKGTVGAFDVGTNGIVYASTNLHSPAQLFAIGLAGGKPQQLTNANVEALTGVVWGDRERFRFKGWNDEEVQGVVVEPAGYRSGVKYPVAFLIHGGPQGSFGNSWSYRWNPQIFANAGYAVVMIDFHGSTGYGQDFTDSISGHWGDRPLEDLKKGWAHALGKYPFLDETRACALGASYGGFMVAWIASQWNEPWKCLVDHDGVFDAHGMGYSTEELWFDEWERGGAFYDVPENYEKFNPASHVKQWKKPMLVIHGDKDFRIPLAQGIGAFTALQRLGIESKFLFFPDENHWVLKPQNSVLWHKTVLDWLNRWTGK